MKKLFVSMGLIAAGTAGLQGAYAPDMNPVAGAKIWSVSGTLRGFYDDNYLTAAQKQGSAGFELSPQLDLNMALQQTELGLRYTYGMYYYQERENLGQDPIDQTHQFDLWVDHAFSERWQGKVLDSFVVGQEPELIGGGQDKRVDGNNIRNTATLSLNTEWTRLWSTQLGYQNTIYDYENANGTAANPSLAGTLNRIEQSVSLDLQMAVARETMAFIGGMFGWVDYTAGEPIAQYGPTTFYSDSRNNRSYFGYVGASHSMLANLSFNGRVGFQYTDSYNESGSTSLNPYANISLIYTYLPGCYAQLGFTQTENASQTVAVNNQGQLTQYQDTSSLYASINHKLTPRLLGSIVGNWSHQVYNQGAYNNQADDFYNLGVNLSYSFNPHFSAEVGYNFDDLQSQVPGNGYNRNRVYFGVSATY
ncbi:MAG: outer membrane beta-barrel protein [Limisphaerales bacterium]